MNSSIRKQIDHQLKEAGVQPKQVKHESVEKKPALDQSRYANMQVRPLNPKPQQHKKTQYNEVKPENSETDF